MTTTTPADATAPGQTTNPAQKVLVHSYTPRGTAKQVMQIRFPELLVSGPAGTGKSRACLEKVLAVALGTARTRVLVVRKTNVSLTSTTLVTWREHVAREAIESGLCAYYGGSREEPAQYRFGNGSAVVIGGLDNPTKIMSSEYDLIYVGEATELDVADWDALSSRLRNHRISFQQLLADCNPDRPTHWLKQRCDEGKTGILYSQHWENPRLFEEVPPGVGGEVERHDDRSYRVTDQGRAYLGRLKNLTGVRKLRLLDGVWCAADGLVYDNWNPAVHILPKTMKRIPADWPRYWVVDFGFTNPFCCQWWAEDPDGRLIMYREIYMTKRLVEDHARHMLCLVTSQVVPYKLPQREADERDPLKAVTEGRRRWIEPRPTAIICDHDAEDRATLERHLGMGTVGALKSKRRGIQVVESRLKVQEDGKPRLLLVPGALVELDQALKDAGKPVCTADEFGSYVWPAGKSGKEASEEPVKENDHGMDDVRYVCAYKDFRRRFADRDVFLEG
jgi:hypothetical protein